MKKIVLIGILILSSLLGKSQMTYYCYGFTSSNGSFYGLDEVSATYNEILDNMSGYEGAYYYTESEVGSPDLSHFTNGTITVHFDCSEYSSSYILVSCKLYRINSNGVEQESTAFSSPQTANSGALTFNFPSVTWSSGNSTDHFGVAFHFQNTSASSQYIIYHYGTGYTWIETPFSEITTERRIFIIN